MKILGNRSFDKILLFELISKLLIFVVSEFHIANQCFIINCKFLFGSGDDGDDDDELFLWYG